MNYKNITMLILLALFIIACLQNIEVIPMHFLFWKLEISKLLLLIVTLIIGIIIGLIIPGLLTKSKAPEDTQKK